MRFCVEAKRCIFDILILTIICGTLIADSFPATICPPSEVVEPCECKRYHPSSLNTLWCEDVSDVHEVLSRVTTNEYQFETFSMFNSSVMFIPESVFQVPGLRILSVAESSLVTVFNSTPTTGNHIRVLILKKVQILLGLDWKMLSGFHELRYLVIRQSNFSVIDQAFVDHAPESLEEMHITNCPTTRWIHDEAFASLPNLKKMTVLNGEVREMKRSMFPTPSKLVEFSFGGNRLFSLPEDMFSEMPDLKSIFLGRNLFKEMPENVFGPVVPNLKDFYFDENPLECGCQIRWITVLEKKSQLFGSCQVPEILHGRKIRNLVPEDFLHCD